MSVFEEETNNATSMTPPMSRTPSVVSDYQRDPRNVTLFDLGGDKKITEAQFASMAMGAGYTPARSCPNPRELCYIAIGIGLGLFFVLLVAWLFPVLAGRRCIPTQVNVEEAVFSRQSSPRPPVLNRQRRHFLEDLSDDEAPDFNILMREVEELRAAARDNVQTTRDRLMEVLSRQNPPTYAETFRGSGDGAEGEEDETMFTTAREYNSSSNETLVPETTSAPMDVTMTVADLEGSGGSDEASGETMTAAVEGVAVDLV